MDKEVAIAIVIVIVAVVAFFVVRAYLAGDFETCLQKCEKSSATLASHINCSETCQKITDQGKILVNLTG